MKCLSLVLGFAIGLLLVAVATAATPNEQPKSKEIPLDQIWSFRIPGTKSVRDLEPKVELKELSVDEMIRVSIVHRIYNSLTRGKAAAPAFVVEGTGAVALKNAEAVFLGADPLEKLKANTDLTLIFYTLLGREVRIDSIEQARDRITIKYHFIMREANGMWADFALIPLGTFSAGVVDVDIVEQPIDGAEPSGLEDRVSGPFSFQVTK